VNFAIDKPPIASAQTINFLNFATPALKQLKNLSTTTTNHAIAHLPTVGKMGDRLTLFKIYEKQAF